MSQDRLHHAEKAAPQVGEAAEQLSHEQHFPVRHRPHQVSPSAWIAPTATVLGDVTIGEEASIWFGAVARGDTAPITIGARTNIQDLVVLHADPGFPCILGADITVGHGAIVHGANIEDGVLIGIRATVLNGARIGSGSIIGAGALVTEGADIPPHSLVLGIPGRVVRQTTEADLERIRHGSAHYVQASAAYKAAQTDPDHANSMT